MVMIDREQAIANVLENQLGQVVIQSICDQISQAQELDFDVVLTIEEQCDKYIELLLNMNGYKNHYGMCRNGDLLIIYMRLG